uniref:Uncharacterized protein n=1 Tax=Rhizophora mucronata TaxID=61149 RepID=A0A2P2Q7B3_RHIMU
MKGNKNMEELCQSQLPFGYRETDIKESQKKKNKGKKTLCFFYLQSKTTQKLK